MVFEIFITNFIIWINNIYRSFVTFTRPKSSQNVFSINACHIETVCTSVRFFGHESFRQRQKWMDCRFTRRNWRWSTSCLLWGHTNRSWRRSQMFQHGNILCIYIEILKYQIFWLLVITKQIIVYISTTWEERFPNRTTWAITDLLLRTTWKRWSSLPELAGKRKWNTKLMSLSPYWGKYSSIHGC